MKATALLEKQHRKVEGIFKKLEEGKGDGGAQVIELANDLAAHMAIEQQIFYPAIREIDPDLVAKSYQEHAVAELALKRLLATSPQDDTFKAKVTTLKELIEHHVDEEEDELFPAVEKAAGDDVLNDLGKRMKVMFDEAVLQGFEKLVPKGMGTTSADESNKAPKKQRATNGESAARRPTR